jgi:NADPH-dependent 2,4-dienoyl-CoA reductase/sulfur reductase-like enzyme
MRGSDAVYTIRHVDDLRTLRSAAQANRHAVIIGTSFVGMEAASALRQRGLKVTVVGKETLPFEKQLGPQIASSLLSLHKKKGVRFILGARLIQIANRYVLVEEGGRERQIDADLVILGVGVSPNLDFKHDLPLAAEGGVLTDKSLRAADKVWVAGDIASIGGIRIELESCPAHGMHAAKQMLGQKKPLHVVPFFWTYHFGKRINYLGRGEEWDDISITGNLCSFDFLALQSKSGVVRSVISCGRETETALLAELLHRPLSKQGAHTALCRL